MEKNHDIDKKFNEANKAFDEFPAFPAFEKVWNTIEEKLDQKENKKRIIPVWFPYGIAAGLAVGLGVFYFLNKKEAVDTAKPVIVENTVSHKPGFDIAKTDSIIKSNLEKKNEVIKLREEQPVLANENPQGKSLDNLPPPPLPEPVVVKVEYQPEDLLVEQQVISGIKSQKNAIINSSPMISNNTTGYLSNQLGTTLAVEAKSQGMEIVALGYSRSKKMKAIKDEGYVENRSNISYLNTLQGSAPGLEVKSGSETPVIIRGMKSVNTATEPLIVIDGKLYNYNIFSALDPLKIKKVNVLKGDKASSIYGSRGANGVIVVEMEKLSRKERKKLQKISDSYVPLKTADNFQINNEEYHAFVENPFELTKTQPLSTFSIDVDNASYSNVRRMINNGEKVDKNAVRIEEMVNYFKYDYPQPKNDQPFSINTEYNEAPWNPNHKLLKIGLQGKNIPMNNLPSSNLIFLIDVSGSMNEANKLPLLKSSFKVLLNQLRPQDKVGIVVYAGNAGMVLPPTPAQEKEKIMTALDHLQAGGSTAGGAGIELAYKLAQENFVKGGNNRVIIATDGDFNVGASSKVDLETLIEEKRKSGVFLTCLGFGMGNYKDNRLETLADKGNGNYAYIDNMQEANKFLGKEFAGSMYAIAKDVKIQIEFNPKYVKSYRLIGYENRKLKNEDFTNDKIDAGELGSGHTVTALYEVIPANVDSEFSPKENDLKYTKTSSSQNFGDELATIKFRYKKPDGDRSMEISEVVKKSDASISAASPDFKFASSVAWFGLVLRNSGLIKDKNLTDIENLAKQGRNKDEEGYRSEFLRLIESYKTIQK
ncbi:Ca-activated chloride channel family protein [Chryseobacterium sp. H1D6B]|uniref:vWA domain-containing protein n=1 Tax=Chryseobacterium sp. H1D6B TaxID=2940588 RepID=UPI0015C95C3F|nr:von Willebrand factor type A domain-containing protein [Chryseobacterium sp. H1D6B]MDH6254411.1 Ca-activated chloride channel family protein [Chryseobacterium sp. H1D6B]